MPIWKKERYADGMSLSEAFAAALAALSTAGNGDYTAAQLEVAILERARDHRTFRRIRAARLEELLAESHPAADFALLWCRRTVRLWPFVLRSIIKLPIEIPSRSGFRRRYCACDRRRIAARRCLAIH